MAADEVYIVDAIRTPLGKRNGALSTIHPVTMLSQILSELVIRNSIDHERIDDTIIGCVTQTGEQGSNIARNALLSAGFPESVTGVTVDRQCGSSLQAVEFGSYAVASGMMDLVIAGGVESMSRVPMGSNMSDESWPADSKIMKKYFLGNRSWFNQAMGASMIAHEFSITREEMDHLGFESHMRAAKNENNFQREIIPVYAEKGDSIIKISRDEGIRKDTTLEKMSALKPAFQGIDLITAGNSSQISDGASGVLLASEKAVEEHSLKPRARIVSLSHAGVDPVTMLKGPIPVTEKLLNKSGLKLEDIDIFEINEAFSSVVLAWEKHFHVDHSKVNVSGGAIALGHPLGATGTRIISTAINNLEMKSLNSCLIAICEGGGMANGAIIERV